MQPLAPQCGRRSVAGTVWPALTALPPRSALLQAKGLSQADVHHVNTTVHALRQLLHSDPALVFHFIDTSRLATFDTLVRCRGTWEGGWDARCGVVVLRGRGGT